MKVTFQTIDSRRTVTRKAAKLANQQWREWLAAGADPKSAIGQLLARMDPNDRTVYVSQNAPFEADWKGDVPGLALHISDTDAALIDSIARAKVEQIVTESMHQAMLDHKAAFLGEMLRDMVHNEDPYYPMRRKKGRRRGPN